MEQDFNQLMAAVEKSPRERFSIGRIVERESCLSLIRSIPKLQVRTLEFHLHRNLQYLKADIILAVKRNASLCTVIGKMDTVDCFDNDDRKKLACFSSRNEFLAQWIENPTAVPKASWAQALYVAQVTGPDTVFRILRMLAPSLGSSFVPPSRFAAAAVVNPQTLFACCCSSPWFVGHGGRECLLSRDTGCQ
jgi:hypothetical protein